jgi:hypothetical protein
MSDEPKKPKSHPIRLAALMLSGTLIGIASTPAVGNGLDFWWYARPFAQALAGAVIGLSIEVILRGVESDTP